MGMLAQILTRINQLHLVTAFVRHNEECRWKRLDRALLERMPLYCKRPYLPLPGRMPLENP
jgi:hypothetical protein